MALKDRIKEPPAPMHGLPCSIGVLLAQLEGEERDALLAMLGTPEKRGWAQRAIYDALTDEGYTVGLQTINKHRSGQCRCSKGES